jgi:hypothetical protein
VVGVNRIFVQSAQDCRMQIRPVQNEIFLKFRTENFLEV